MKKILIVIYNLAAGGAQKSLVSFLNTIPQDKYSIDLFLLNKEGLFLSQVPDFVNIIEANKIFKSIHHSLTDINFFFPQNYTLWWNVFLSRLKSKKYKKNHREQAHWQTWHTYIDALSGEYDCAISYVEGAMNYFVIDKVKAKRKILWIHNVYAALHYDISFDYNYFSRADRVVTMSKSGLLSLQENFPSIKSKFIVLENISNSGLIEKLYMESIKEKEYENFDGLKLLSIGRLMDQKNYPLAIAAAAELHRRNVKFLWYVIGEGVDRLKLESLVEKESLGNCFKMIGLRSNPYQYMRVADIIVMTSKFEGRSIALDEAKILHKLIVTTNYASATDVVDNCETGLICEMTSQAVAESIIKLSLDKSLTAHIVSNLKSRNWDNTSEINKYYEAIETLD